MADMYKWNTHVQLTETRACKTLWGVEDPLGHGNFIPTVVASKPVADH